MYKKINTFKNQHFFKTKNFLKSHSMTTIFKKTLETAYVCILSHRNVQVRTILIAYGKTFCLSQCWNHCCSCFPLDEHMGTATGTRTCLTTLHLSSHILFYKTPHQFLICACGHSLQKLIGETVGKSTVSQRRKPFNFRNLHFSKCSMPMFCLIKLKSTHRTLRINKGRRWKSLALVTVS